jgi:succinyl-diaminopimelate desuccinylase
MPAAHHSDTVKLTCDLIERPSVTPEDAGCQDLLGERLAAIGFDIERLDFGEVKNLWAHRGQGRPTLVFLGHTDVVPTGPVEEWTSDPFTPTIEGDLLRGRGAADMKGSLAAMVTAMERFLSDGHEPSGSIGFLVTSDEEGPAVDGTVKVIDHLWQTGQAFEFCVVGEPSSSTKLGDRVRNGRRGSINGVLTIRGVQGHVAYPEQVDNPIHRAGDVIAALAAQSWDTGSEFFPPTSFQVSNVKSGTGAENVVPGHAELMFNFRFSTALDAETIKSRVESIVKPFADDYEINWRLSGVPFLTESGRLMEAVRDETKERLGYAPEFSTGGGTSDGRFVAPRGVEVVELGPINATIHQTDECVTLTELDELSRLYEGIMRRLLG